MREEKLMEKQKLHMKATVNAFSSLSGGAGSRVAVAIDCLMAFFVVPLLRFRQKNGGVGMPLACCKKKAATPTVRIIKRNYQQI